MDSLMLSVHQLMAAAAEPLTGSSGAATEHAEEPQLAELVHQEAGLRDEAGACSGTEHVAIRNEERWRQLRKVAEAIRLNGGILGRRMKYADTESTLVRGTRPSPKYELGQSVHHFWAS